TWKDPARGTRGSNAQPGDVDLEIIIAGDIAKTATIEKANDQPTGPLTTYRLASFVLQLAEDGDPVTPATVADDPPAAEATRRKPTPTQKLHLDALTEALLDHPTVPPAT